MILMHTLAKFKGKIFALTLRFIYGSRLVIGEDFRIYGKMPFIKLPFRGSGSISIGKHCHLVCSTKYNWIGISAPVSICSYGGRIIIGDNVGISGSAIVSFDQVRIGSWTIVGSGALIIDSNFHSLDAGARRYERVDSNYSDVTSEAVNIGQDVFIGARSIICKGVTLGDRAVVGAGVVLARSLDEGQIAVGAAHRILDKKL